MIDAENNSELIDEGFRLAEKNLDSQISLALAADQRSITFCGILIAAIAIATSVNGGSAQSVIPSLGIVLLGISAGISAYSARPVKVFPSGYEISGIEEDLAENRSPSATRLDLAKEFEKSSRHNREVIKKNARAFKWALITSCMGFGLLIWPDLKLVICRIPI